MSESDLWNDSRYFHEVEEKVYCEEAESTDSLDWFVRFFGVDPEAKLTPAHLELVKGEVNQALEIILKDFPNFQVELGIFGMSSKHSLVAGPLGASCGYAFQDQAVLLVNPRRLVRGAVVWSLVHEFNHVVRFRSKGPTRSIRDHMFIEGLAEAYVAERLGGSRTATTVPPAGDPTDWVKLLRGEWHMSIRSSRGPGWFNGSKRRGIPRWFGYWYGFEQVQALRKERPSRSWESMMKLESAAIE